MNKCLSIIHVKHQCGSCVMLKLPKRDPTVSVEKESIEVSFCIQLLKCMSFQKAGI